MLGGWSGGMIKGMPELKMLPSYAKDEMQMIIHMMQARNPAELPSQITNYATQKFNNLAQLLIGLASGQKRDMFGWRQITDLTPGAKWSWGLPPGWAKFIGDLYAPITTAQEQPKGGIKPTWPEAGPFGIGIRNVPTALTDPARIAAAQKKSDLYTAKDQLGQELGHEKNLENPDVDIAQLQATLAALNSQLRGGGGGGPASGGAYAEPSARGARNTIPKQYRSPAYGATYRAAPQERAAVGEGGSQSFGGPAVFYGGGSRASAPRARAAPAARASRAYYARRYYRR
jgi:hypothetical protein